MLSKLKWLMVNVFVAVFIVGGFMGHLAVHNFLGFLFPHLVQPQISKGWVGITGCQGLKSLFWKCLVN